MAMVVEVVDAGAAVVGVVVDPWPMSMVGGRCRRRGGGRRSGDRHGALHVRVDGAVEGVRPGLGEGEAPGVALLQVR